MFIQQALASLNRFADRHIPEEKAVRILRRFDTFTRVILPICMIGFACGDLLRKFMNPQVATTVPATPSGGTLQGRVASVTVELIDPSFLDRLVATSPSLVNFTLVASAFGYMLWAGKVRKVKEVEVPRRIKLIVSVAASVAVFLIVGPVVTALLVSEYFDVRVALYGTDMGSLLLVSAVTLLLFTATEGNIGWITERQRAEKLDGQMKDVV